MSRLRGVLAVFQTPFRDDESIDWPIVERELEWLFDHGADGIVLAMVSEVLRLSHQERRELAETASRVAKPRGAVVISVGAESTHTAVQLARHAEQVGADAIMAIPPLSVALGEGGLLEYYERILKSVDIPLIVQDASGYVGRPMSIGLQSRLYKLAPDRVMFKPEAIPIGPRLSALHVATGGEAVVFEGSGGVALVDSYARGVSGTMPGADLIRPLVALWQALERNDLGRAREISLPLASLIALQPTLDAFLAVEKHLLVRQGVFTSTRVRQPAAFGIDEQTAVEVDRLFDLLIEMIE